MNLKTFLKHFDTIAEAPGGIPKLRSLILDLAVRGKLVPQNPEDESAELLRNQIVVEKQKLEKLKKIGKQRSLTPVQEDEQPYVLPSNWCWCRWNDVALHIGDIDHKMPTEVSEGIPYVSPRDFKEENTIDFKGAKKISYEDFERLKRKVQPTKGDIIFPRYGTIGENRLVEVDIDFLASYSCAVIKNFHGYIESKYSYYYSISKFVKSEIERYTNKTTQANVGIQSIQNFIYPLPPLAEQKRIVEKVDELMGLCDRLSSAKQTRDNLRQKLRESAIASLMNAETDEELEKGWAIVRDNWCEVSQCPEDVKDLRKSVLQLAVRGKLVPQNPEDEPSIKALQRMQFEKLDVLQTEGYRTKRKKIDSKNDEYEIDFQLPTSWTLAELDDLCIFIDYRGQTPQKTKSGIRLITAKNVRDGFIKIDPKEFVSDETYHNWMTRGFPKKGDVLFTTEAPLGKAAVVDIEERFALAQRIINLRPLSGIYGNFLMWLILSSWFQNELQERATGMTATGIKAAKLKLIRIPLPPLAEQKRIVAKVDELMRLCDKLEASLRQSQQRAESLAASAISHLTL